MALIALLNKEAAGSRRDMAIAIVVSGVSNAVILAVINAAAQTASHETLNFRFLVMFAIAMTLYVVGLKYTLDSATRVFEQMITKVRLRLVEKIAGSELLLLHQIGQARIYQCIAQDTTMISESQGLLVAAAQSTVMVLCTAVYVMTVSLPAFLTVAGAVGAGILIYMIREKDMMQLIQNSMDEEIHFFAMTADLIDGLKEIKLSQARGGAILTDLGKIAQSMRDLKIETTNLYNQNAVFSQCFFYLLIAVIVFVLPRLMTGFAPVVPQLVATVLFIIGPLSTIVTALPAYSKANRAADAITALEEEVDRVNAAMGRVRASEDRHELRNGIECRALEFGYAPSDPSAFRIGPIDLTIPQGEITMVIGGNGSGKTTFLKVFAGLYTPTGGSLLADGRQIGRETLQEYREMFSAIYTDFHLFRKLYGIAAKDEEVRAELEHMGIAHKVSYRAEHGFDNLDLSTGQRKRIAMAVTLLEDRPVMIFDEWAADQDPDFRRYFYEALLPDLRAQGKTLIVATHDDHYFHIADTVVKMDLGKVRSVQRARTP